MLTAFGPIVTDFYLPSMPEMQEDFHTSSSLVAMSLTAGMLGLSLGQILIGPLSDKYGRKRLLVGSMLLFALSSMCCVVAKDVMIFNFFRVIQGFGGAGGMVLSKSVSADMFSGKDLADFMAILGAINGIAPVMAPIVGGATANFTGWRGVFCVLLAIGVVLMVCSARLRETLPPERRTTGSVMQAYTHLFKVFRNRRFTLPTLAMMCSFFAFFAYISSSPFIFQQVYGLSPMEFSLCFALNAVMIGAGSILAPLFRHQDTAMKWASLNLMVSAVLVALCLLLRWPLLVLMPCYVYLLLSFGLLQPGAASIALDAERSNAGAASAVYGAAAFLAGSLVSPLTSVGNLLMSTSCIIVVGALGCLALTLPLCATLKREGMSREGAE